MGETDTQAATQSTPRTASVAGGAAQQVSKPRRRRGFLAGLLSGLVVSVAGLLVLNAVLPKSPMVPNGTRVEVLEPAEEPPAETAEVSEPTPEPVTEADTGPTPEEPVALEPEETAGDTPEPEVAVSDVPVVEPEPVEPTPLEPEPVTPEPAAPEPEPTDAAETPAASEPATVDTTAIEDPAPAAPEAVTPEAPVLDEEAQTDVALAPGTQEAEPQPQDTGPAWLVNAVPFEAAGDTPLIGLILERPGSNEITPEQIFALGLPVTLAIVPDGASATQLGGQAREAGYEVIAHLPMEPRGTADPGPEALRVEMSPEEVAAQTRRLIARLPDAVAASNFMGSKATEDEALMQTVIGTLNEDGVAFIDSRTSPRSKAFRVAEGLGGRFARNSRFIPEEVTSDQAYRLLERAADEARQRGGTVLIGPANREMLLGLQRWALERNGKKARLAPISAILRLEGGR